MASDEVYTLSELETYFFMFKIVRNALSNSYTMGCLPVRGDNARALASGLSYVQVDKLGITILYHLHQSWGLGITILYHLHQSLGTKCFSDFIKSSANLIKSRRKIRT